MSLSNEKNFGDVSHLEDKNAIIDEQLEHGKPIGDDGNLSENVRRGSVAVVGQLRSDAMEAEANERSMGLVEGLRTYPTAVLWSFGISLLIGELLVRGTPR